MTLEIDTLYIFSGQESERERVEKYETFCTRCNEIVSFFLKKRKLILFAKILLIPERDDFFNLE